MNSKLATAWERVSLRTKLTALSVSLIGLLLVVSSFGTISLLRTYLQANVDTLLSSTAAALAHEDPAQVEMRLATHQLQLPSLPSDFYIAYVDINGDILIGLVSSASDENEIPNVSNFSSSYVMATKGRPFEVDSNGVINGTTSDHGWRMVAVPLTSMPGSLVVALPTGANNALLAQYGYIGGGFGLLLLLLSGLSIWLTISSALKPLNEVERTAEAVSAGDISQRLVEHPGQTEMARLNRSLNSMLDGVETAMKDRAKTLDQMRRFVADASHELRTPLVSVRGYAELYRMGALDQPQKVAEAMSRIESEAVRMTGLVESLLTLTRLDETQQLKKTRTNIVSLAVDAAKDASVADGNRKIVVTDMNGKELEGQVEISANVDANSMRQVLTNLLANAARFSPADAQIEVAIDANAKLAGEQRLIIEVRDHGEGIPEQLRKKVFERFYRVDNSRNSETGGSGLGLSIVSSIVARHGGTIEATETPDGGATFRVDVPA
ncbi:ATP-binding protein [Rhodoluna sp.]|uniref:sensor histidine kinase n=1 Tax=Rhodoluna sp. TaxID=1969481 RepID=UPI0025FF5AEF|nr:ATP-binding protein [Rhodoluna sp.]